MKKGQRDQALSVAVETHRGRLRTLLRGWLRGETSEADDVLQEVFEEFVEAYDVGLAVESLGAWLARVARNRVFDRFRRRRSQRDYRESILNSENAEATATDGPEDEWTRKILRTEIVSALEKLPAEQREVFVKHELQGMTFEEIAAESGVNVSTLLSRKRYAVQFLRNHLKEIYDELE